MDAGWDAADVVVEGTYELPLQEHAYLQPEAAVSYMDEEGRITIEIAGQWIHEDQEQIAHALDLAPEQVRVIYPAIGGAFGGREDMSLQIVLALAARKLHERGIDRPIRSQWSREESIVGHHKRHRGRDHRPLGSDSRWPRSWQSKPTAISTPADTTTRPTRSLGNLHLCVAGPYEVPNARIDSYGVYTNGPVGGAFRGFGAPQGAFVAETQMNKLADSLGHRPGRTATAAMSCAMAQSESPRSSCRLASAWCR